MTQEIVRIFVNAPKNCKHTYIRYDHNLCDSSGKLLCKVYICPDCGHKEYRT